MAWRPSLKTAVACLRCDTHHSRRSWTGVSVSSQLAGMVPPRDKQENDMTDLNNEVRELSNDELDAVSGGDFLHVLDAALGVTCGGIMRAIGDGVARLVTSD